MLKNLLFLIFIIATAINFSFSEKDKPTYMFEIAHYVFENANNQTYKIRYMSDKLEIEGFLIKPRYIEPNTKLPLIIYNRGGNCDFGAIEYKQLMFMNKLAGNGYVVMASQYRGNLTSEGQDEFGGSDINDIIQLTNLAKKMKFVDTNNIGSIGISRGGLMSLILSKKTDVIKTHVCIGAPTDLFKSIAERPIMYSDVYQLLIGDTLSNRQEYVKRSPIYWAKEINEPILLLHGGDDLNVNVSQAKNLIDSLNIYNKKSSLQIFEGGNHGLSSHMDKRDSLIVDWFNKHLKN
ncbi:MAG: S9 family peptidase [Crocinitomix sp.]|nr:S9 family peptidase [Crocinitomix sp.]